MYWFEGRHLRSLKVKIYIPSESPEPKAKKGQYLLVVSLSCYKWIRGRH